MRKFIILGLFCLLNANIIPNGNYFCKPIDVYLPDGTYRSVSNNDTYIVSIIDKELILTGKAGVLPLFYTHMRSYKSKGHVYKMKTYVTKDRTIAVVIANEKFGSKNNKPCYIFAFGIKGKEGILENKCCFINNKISIEK